MPDRRTRPPAAAARQGGRTPAATRTGTRTGTRTAGTSTGAPPGRRRGALRLAGLVLLVAVVAAVVALAGRSGDGGEDVSASIQERAAELERQEAQRDVAQVEQLTGLAGEAVEVLSPLAQALAPPGRDARAPGAAAAPLPPDRLERAARDVAALQERLAAGPTGSTQVNATREALVSSARLFGASVEAYRLAGDPALAGAGQRAARLGADLGDQARAAFVAAATQLDLANIATGRGHVHVSLSPEDASLLDR